jgi:hypothetical protein
MLAGVLAVGEDDQDISGGDTCWDGRRVATSVVAA